MWALSLLAGWPAPGGAAVCSGMGWGAPTVQPGLLPPILPSLTAQVQMLETGLQRAAGSEDNYIYLQTEAGMSI